MYFYDNQYSSEKKEIPNSEMMFQPIMKALKELGGEASVEEIDSKAIEIMGLSERLYLIPHRPTSNRTEVSYRLAWARSCLRKYGWIINVSRGFWKISPDFKCELEEINPKDIMKSIRQGNLINGIPISNLESASVFEKFAYSVMTSYVEGQNKAVKNLKQNKDNSCNLYLPDGYDDVNVPTYVIFKYSVANNSAYYKLIENILQQLDNIIEPYASILIVFGAVLYNKKQLNEQACKRYNSNIVIWDYTDLEKRVSGDPYQMELQFNPKKALVDEAIMSIPTEEEQKETRKDLIASLRTSYAHEEVALFLGAGVSIDAGIPLWADMIKILLINMIESKIEGKELSKADRVALNELAYKNQEDSPLTQMRYIRTAFENDEYYKLVHDALYSELIKSSTKLVDTIAKLGSPKRNHCGVKGIVTYNFDNLVELKLKSRDIDYNVVFRETDMPDINSLNIYHVHGYLPRDISEIDDILESGKEMELIFSEEDYHKVYRDAYCWSNLTQLNFFRDSTCLFIGSSLTDPNLRRLLDVAARNGEAPRHYAILIRKKIADAKGAQKKILKLYQGIDNNVRESYYKSLGINIIWVDKYEEIPNILESLMH